MTTTTGPQAIVLASDNGSRLYPLTGGSLPKALLPIGNRPLLSYPLAMIEACGVHHVIIVCSGKEAADQIHSWVGFDYDGGLHLELRVIPESLGSADAIRAVADSLTAVTVAVLSVDAVSDVPLSALLATHTMRNAAVTAMLHPRRVLPSSETKPGKTPKNVEYIGLSSSGQTIISLAGNPNAQGTVSLPWNRMQDGGITLRTDLEQAHVYVFNRTALMTTLELKPQYSSLKQEVLPWMVRNQQCFVSRPLADNISSTTTLEGSLSENLDVSKASPGIVGNGDQGTASTHPGVVHSEDQPSCGVAVYLPDHAFFCARANTTQAFADISKDITTPLLATRLLGAPTNPRHENWMDASTKLGQKATVGAGCIVAPGCIIGDKCTLKRSIVGRGVTFGRDVKVINSVVMAGASVGEGAHVQGSILCDGVHVEAHASLKDCQVGAGFVIAEGADHRGEALARSPRVGRGAQQHRGNVATSAATKSSQSDDSSF